MAEFEILSENEVETSPKPDILVKQRVITYKAPGFAPRTVWVDVDNLPDAVFQRDNPGKPVPPEIQAKGDAVRRKAFEADLKQQAQLPGPRKV